MVCQRATPDKIRIGCCLWYARYVRSSQRSYNVGWEEMERTLVQMTYKTHTQSIACSFAVCLGGDSLRRRAWLYDRTCGFGAQAHREKDHTGHRAGDHGRAPCQLLVVSSYRRATGLILVTPETARASLALAFEMSSFVFPVDLAADLF